MPQESQPVSPGLEALLHTAAFAPIQDLGWLRVTGADRVRWLNGMATNNIAGPHPRPRQLQLLPQRPGPHPGRRHRLAARRLHPPRNRLPRLPGRPPRPLHHHGRRRTRSPHHSRRPPPSRPHRRSPPHRPRPHRPACKLPHPPPLRIPARRPPPPPQPPHPPLRALVRPRHYRPPHRNPAPRRRHPATPTDLEHLRILAGTPLYGTDIRNTDTARDLPQETNQTHALHFAKGCYLGQEIVERIRSRGAVHRTFTGFTLTPDPPDFPPPDPPHPATTKPSANSPASPRSPATGTRQMALGYIRREVLDRAASTGIQYPGGVATPHRPAILHHLNRAHHVRQATSLRRHRPPPPHHRRRTPPRRRPPRSQARANPVDATPEPAAREPQLNQPHRCAESGQLPRGPEPHPEPAADSPQPPTPPTRPAPPAPTPSRWSSPASPSKPPPTASTPPFAPPTPAPTTLPR